MTLMSTRRITSSSRSGTQDRNVTVDIRKAQPCPKCGTMRSGSGPHAPTYSRAPPGYGEPFAQFDCAGDLVLP